MANLIFIVEEGKWCLYNVHHSIIIFFIISLFLDNIVQITANTFLQEYKAKSLYIQTSLKSAVKFFGVK